MFDAYLKVALLGRPNVGKSTLFNRLIRSNRAITHDRPGVTRDRMEGIVRPKDSLRYTVIDTGGVTLASSSTLGEGPDELQGFEEEILLQAEDAVKDAALLCLVVDAREGLTPMDRHLADFLRTRGKEIFLVVNKIDGPENADIMLAEFYELGFDMLPISASHGFNVRKLEKEISERLNNIWEAMDPEDRPGISEEDLDTHDFSDSGSTFNEGLEFLSGSLDESPDNSSGKDSDDAAKGEVAYDAEEKAPTGGIDFSALDDLPAELSLDDLKEAAKEKFDLPFYTKDGPLRLALLGRPNAGKSSLVNVLAGEERMIVSDIAGTTRDSVDVTVNIDGEPCIFVDTAGVRRPSRIKDTVERFSVNASIKTTTKAHVTLLVLNAEEGITQQDKRLIELLDKRKTPFMVLLNKTDLIPKSERKEAEKDLDWALSFCNHVPVLFVSALRKLNLNKIIPLAKKIREECKIRIPTGQLNRALTTVITRHQPPIVKTARAKFFYVTQAETSPPTFVFFVNSSERVLASYARYIEKSFRHIFTIEIAPIRMRFRSAHAKKRN